MRVHLNHFLIIYCVNNIDQVKVTQDICTEIGKRYFTDMTKQHSENFQIPFWNRINTHQHKK